MCGDTMAGRSPGARSRCKYQTLHSCRHQIRAESPGFVSALNGVILQRKVSTLTHSPGPECLRYLFWTDYPRTGSFYTVYPFCLFLNDVSAHAPNSSAQTGILGLLIFNLDCPLARTRLISDVGSSFFTPDLHPFIQAVKEVSALSGSFYLGCEKALEIWHHIVASV